MKIKLQKVPVLAPKRVAIDTILSRSEDFKVSKDEEIVS